MKASTTSAVPPTARCRRGGRAARRAGCARRFIQKTIQVTKPTAMSEEEAASEGLTARNVMRWLENVEQRAEGRADADARATPQPPTAAARLVPVRTR